MNNTLIHPNNFIRNIIEQDLKNAKHQLIVTRFPPEPNGYLHIGHAKAICHNFSIAKDYYGKCNLRFDDTNPDHENEEYVASIENDIKWLGYNWDGEVKYASDYFDQLYQYALWFIEQGLAYVDDLDAEALKLYRGTLTEGGSNSPYRNRDIATNITLFKQMKDGEFADGAKTLRLKIDMSAANINLRDPVIYRVKRAHHIRTKDKWCIYPMYDYTHSISDALEGITHSCCTLEFEDHRPLYDWIVKHLYQAGLVDALPRQIEFSRLELRYTITSKRKLKQLLSANLVKGWDDPRMPTIIGMRRRGYTPSGINLFIQRCGLAKSPNIVEMAILESSVREDLEHNAARVMAILNPLTVILTNFTSELSNSREIPFHPQLPQLGNRICQLEAIILIEASDFQQFPQSGFQRLSVGTEVRLRHSYIIRCQEIIKNHDGTINMLKCTIDYDTLGKNPSDRKVRGVIHWLAKKHAHAAEIRLYENLFTVPIPDGVPEREFIEFINPESLQVVAGFVEESLSKAKAEDKFQFERIGYFVADMMEFDAKNNKLIFNKTVGLKDNWKK